MFAERVLGDEAVRWSKRKRVRRKQALRALADLRVYLNNSVALGSEPEQLARIFSAIKYCKDIACISARRQREGRRFAAEIGWMYSAVENGQPWAELQCPSCEGSSCRECEGGWNKNISVLHPAAALVGAGVGLHRAFGSTYSQMHNLATALRGS